MLPIFLMFVVSGAGLVIYRIARDVGHSIPRTNDDLIFF